MYLVFCVFFYIFFCVILFVGNGLDPQRKTFESFGGPNGHTVLDDCQTTAVDDTRWCQNFARDPRTLGHMYG